MNNHKLYLKRCLEIAKNGLGTSRPNPMVGCVIVYNNVIIGEGFTSPYGGNHAEVNAIKSVKNNTLLKKATLYVTLEPCSHYGKTPPCSHLIIDNGIPNVVIGTIDTHSKVAGKGIEKLKEAGINVTVGALEKECKQHHKRFFTFHNKKRPYIILKWAETPNGFIAPETKKETKPVWITNKISRQLVHKWRAEEQAILIGTNTAFHDNPSLTVRHWTGNNPIRVIIDKENKLPKLLSVFDSEAESIFINNTLENNLKVDFSLTDKIAQQICNALYKKNINSIIVEGGAKTLQTFINEGLWDEARVFKGIVSFYKGIKAPKLVGELVHEEKIMNNTLQVFENSKKI